MGCECRLDGTNREEVVEIRKVFTNRKRPVAANALGLPKVVGHVENAETGPHSCLVADAIRQAGAGGDVVQDQYPTIADHTNSPGFPDTEMPSGR